MDGSCNGTAKDNLAFLSGHLSSRSDPQPDDHKDGKIRRDRFAADIWLSSYDTARYAGAEISVTFKNEIVRAYCPSIVGTHGGSSQHR